MLNKMIFSAKDVRLVTVMAEAVVVRFEMFWSGIEHVAVGAVISPCCL